MAGLRGGRARVHAHHPSLRHGVRGQPDPAGHVNIVQPRDEVIAVLDGRLYNLTVLDGRLYILTVLDR